MKKLLLLAAMPLFSLMAYATTLATATISTQPSAVVPANFLGLSMEWCNIQNVMGTAASGGTDALLQQFVANLRVYGAGPMFIRVGGNSTDANSCPSPTAIQSVQAMSEFATATGAQFTFGVNLITNNLAASQAQAKAYCAGMPAGSILGFEIGNEPDIYATSGWNATTYYAELAQWLAGLQAAQTCTKNMLAPSFATWNGQFNGTFVSSMPGIMVTNYSKGLGMFTQHWYGATNTATSGQLLASAANFAAFRLLDKIKSAHALGMSYRVDEMNTASGGGAPAVSNSFEAALWLLHNALGLAADGADGINIHGGYLAGSAYNYYTPVAITASGNGSFSLVNGGSNAATQPLYYGMLFLEKALHGASTIYPVTLALTPSSANVSAWATVDSANITRMVVVNKDTTNSGNIVVANGATTASVCYLTAPSISSLKGVTVFANFANSTSKNFDTSTNGLPTGTEGFDVLAPSGGVFTFPMATAQAAIIKFGAGGC